MREHILDQLVDLSVIADIVFIDGDKNLSFLLEILFVFETRLPERLNFISLGIGRENLDEVILQTHALKSASSALGMRQLGFMCDEIVALSRRSDFETAQQMLDNVSSNGVESLNFIRSWCVENDFRST